MRWLVPWRNNNIHWALLLFYLQPYCKTMQNLLEASRNCIWNRPLPLPWNLPWTANFPESSPEPWLEPSIRSSQKLGPCRTCPAPWNATLPQTCPLDWLRPHTNSHSSVMHQQAHWHPGNIEVLKFQGRFPMVKVSNLPDVCWQRCQNLTLWNLILYQGWSDRTCLGSQQVI